MLRIIELTILIHRIGRALTASNGRTDSISNLEIDFEILPELYDLSCKVASNVSTLCGEELVDWAPRNLGWDSR
jgi:hypothetical protein